MTQPKTENERGGAATIASPEPDPYMADLSQEPWNQPRIKARETSWEHRMRWTDPDGFERSITFDPGFNSGTRMWGVGSVSIRFVLRGPKGATQFLLYSGWTP